MALRRVYKKQFKGLTLRTGHFYTFKYRAWEHDPKPTIIFMYSIEGIHPNTDHQWRILQAINFTYIPRAQRKRFLKRWMKELERPGDIKFTWRTVTSKHPYLKRAIRRYFFKPATYITNLKEIPFEEVEKVVISTWSKDFSKKITTALRGKFKKAIQARKKVNKKKADNTKKKKTIIRREQAQKRAERKKNA